MVGSGTSWRVSGFEGDSSCALLDWDWIFNRLLAAWYLSFEAIGISGSILPGSHSSFSRG